MSVEIAEHRHQLVAVVLRSSVDNIESLRDNWYSGGYRCCSTSDKELYAARNQRSKC